MALLSQIYRDLQMNFTGNYKDALMKIRGMGKWRELHTKLNNKEVRATEERAK